MERLTTSIIWLLLALSFVNAKANDVPRQNEDIIANYSLDEDDTLRCGIYAALDYCQERQPRVAHFNTIDPKADQYPELNPYLYCAGNPIMYVDPTGEDVWEMDENGHVIRYERNKDIDAFIMNGKKLSFEYGTVTNNKRDYKSETQFTFKDSQSAKTAFKFFADNSNVEYCLVVTENGNSYIMTQYNTHDIRIFVYLNNEKVIEIFHNHPLSSDPSGFYSNDGKNDKQCAFNIETGLGYSPNWYVYKRSSGTFTKYTKERIDDEVIYPEKLGFKKAKNVEKRNSWISTQLNNLWQFVKGIFK